VRRYHVHFLKEKGQINRLSKDATSKKFFFYTKTSIVFIVIFIQKRRADHNEYISFSSNKLNRSWFQLYLILMSLQIKWLFCYTFFPEPVKAICTCSSFFGNKKLPEISSFPKIPRKAKYSQCFACFCFLALVFVPDSKLNLTAELKLFAWTSQFIFVIQLQFFTRTFVLPSLDSCSSLARHKHQSSTEVVELHERSHTLQFLTQTFVLHGFDLCSWPAWHKFKWGRGLLVCMGLLNFRRRSTGMSYPINCVSQR